jgi:ribosome-associated protein
MTDARKLAEEAALALDRKKGIEIEVLRTSHVTTLADYFVIATATSTIHMQSMADEVEKTMDQLGEPKGRMEGRRGGAWLLMDYGSVVVHLFLEETRRFYALERLWKDAEPVKIEGFSPEKPGAGPQQAF